MPLYPHLESLWLENTSMKPFQQTMESSNSGLVQIPTTTSFSPLSKLTKLDFFWIEDLECLPDWFKSLTSLKRLRIWNCSKLKDLRPGIQHLSSLGELEIHICDGLEEMFQNDDAIMWKALNERLHSLWLEEFHKLEALPQVDIDGAANGSLGLAGCWGIFSLVEVSYKVAPLLLSALLLPTKRYWWLL
ncbi:hypothetical protein TIFTF001_049266 [Ficus carica]|uniref:R13L1/DRL21-like LRR repeat region domain-containing protein n=1 Tax=Ficus carica TaxID=3494 RepID=A0AA87Z5P3_FICCA|nr:hypothetical protein TIFTF001_049266 [Ficus carica]